MNNLKFGNNWRRELLLTHTASVVDLDAICSYVLLDEKKLGTDIKSFCSNHWDEHGFDYDVTSFLLWPLDDGQSAEDLMKVLNAKMPDVAKIVKKSVSDAHNLSLNWGLDTEEAAEIDESFLYDDDNPTLNFD